jgi:hypothetical protein
MEPPNSLFAGNPRKREGGCKDLRNEIGIDLSFGYRPGSLRGQQATAGPFTQDISHSWCLRGAVERMGEGRAGMCGDIPVTHLDIYQGCWFVDETIEIDEIATYLKLQDELIGISNYAIVPAVL